MTYWYMQVHPIDQYPSYMKILKQTEFIGLLGFRYEDKYINILKDEVKINDIILMKYGSIATALVKVVDELIEEKLTENISENHFKIKRKVKILDFNQFNLGGNFPQDTEGLKKISDLYSNSYQYIEQWHTRTTKALVGVKGVKVHEIQIKSYKMFQGFSIKFTNKEGYITPITIIAGINGSGKTSLLTYITEFNAHCVARGDHVLLVINGERHIIPQRLSFQAKRNIKILNNSVNYFPVSISKGERLEEQINRYINELVFERDYKPTDAYKKLQSNINDIFSEINLKIEFSGLNKDKQTLFTNTSGNKFPMAALSTGEKTLLTRVLYLYLSDIKDKIILIDEPEISLHPNWQNAVVPLYEAFAKKNNNQIIIATHSPHIISGAKNGSVKLLHLENSMVSVENVQHNYGIEVSNALTEVMGLEHSRPLSIDNKIADLKQLLIKNKTNEFNRLMQELEKEIGKQDTDLRMLKIEMNIRNKNAQD